MLRIHIRQAYIYIYIHIYIVMQHWWNYTDLKKIIYWEKDLTYGTLFTINPVRIGLRMSLSTAN